MARGDRVRISLIDRTRRERQWGVDRERLALALQSYVDRCLGPTWGVAADVRWAADLAPGAWPIVFLDEPRRRGLLGYHELTRHGFPVGVVPVGGARRQGRKLSVLASHELAEMLI